MIILLDTNLWISALVGASMRVRIEKILADKNITILADSNLMEELIAVCKRPKFAKYLYPELVAVFLQILRERLTFIETHSKFQICRDPNDDYLLAICYDGEADYLLTGDNDLLIIQLFHKTQILTLSEFEKKYNFN
jgi:uncharacterized protein